MRVFFNASSEHSRSRFRTVQIAQEFYFRNALLLKSSLNPMSDHKLQLPASKAASLTISVEIRGFVYLV